MGNKGKIYEQIGSRDENSEVVCETSKDRIHKEKIWEMVAGTVNLEENEGK